MNPGSAWRAARFLTAFWPLWGGIGGLPARPGVADTASCWGSTAPALFFLILCRIQATPCSRHWGQRCHAAPWFCALGSSVTQGQKSHRLGFRNRCNRCQIGDPWQVTSLMKLWCFICKIEAVLRWVLCFLNSFLNDSGYTII